MLKNQNSFERLALSDVRPEQRPFEISRSGGVVDRRSGAEFSVSVRGDPDIFVTKFRQGRFELKGSLALKTKYEGFAVSTNPRENPGLMIISSIWELGFRDKHMEDRAINTALALYMVRMIAFWSAKRMTRKTFLWSDFDTFCRRFGPTRFEMPSDEEMLSISAEWQ